MRIVTGKLNSAMLQMMVYFAAIVPCGLPGVTMTSMSQELGGPVAKDQVAEILIGHFGAVMQRSLLGNFDGTTTPTQA